MAEAIGLGAGGHGPEDAAEGSLPDEAENADHKQVRRSQDGTVSKQCRVCEIVSVTKCLIDTPQNRVARAKTICCKPGPCTLTSCSS